MCTVCGAQVCGGTGACQQAAKTTFDFFKLVVAPFSGAVCATIALYADKIKSKLRK